MAGTSRVVRSDPKASEASAPDEQITDDQKAPEQAPEAKETDREKAARKRAWVNPRLAAELPPGIPQGYDPEGGPTKEYRVLCTFVLDDEGREVPQGAVADLSESLAERYLGLGGGYGDNTRPLIEEVKRDDSEDDGPPEE